MTICNGCGGVVGRDCFNPQECEQITRSMYEGPYPTELDDANREIDRLRNILIEHGIDFEKQEPKQEPYLPYPDNSDVPF